MSSHTPVVKKHSIVAPDHDASIVVLEKFIQATRDSGYKGTTSALSELVDNSLQAGARNVWVSITNTGKDPFPVSVQSWTTEAAWTDFFFDNL